MHYQTRSCEVQIQRRLTMEENVKHKSENEWACWKCNWSI